MPSIGEGEKQLVHFYIACKIVQLLGKTVWQFLKQLLIHLYVT